MSTAHTDLAFTKMQGLGNDFVIFDARDEPFDLSADQVRLASDRRYGVGCDQLLTLLPSTAADVYMRVHNSDGSLAEVSGNATRCVAHLVADRTIGATVTVETKTGILQCTRIGADPDEISVDMGKPRLGWQDIPLARAMDTVKGDFELEALSEPSFVNVGNPHAIFFVESADNFDMMSLGPRIETDALFPERINVNVASVDGDNIRLRTWERGAGLTNACGSGASATAVAAARRGLTGRSVTLQLDGGTLRIEWRDDDHIIMSGEAATSFHGKISL